LLGILSTDVPQSVKDTIVDSLWGFLSHKDDIARALQWLTEGNITSADGQEIFSLKPNHKRAIVKRIHKSSSVSDETKAEILQSVLGDDQSDLAKACRLTCQATTSNLEEKEKIWNDILDPKSSHSLYDKNALMGGFYCWDQVDDLDSFYDKFYEQVETLHVNHTFKFVSSFFFGMMPRMKIEDKHIVKLMTIKSQVADNNSMFMKVLQDGIELLIRSRKIREMAAAKL
jgi:hypothetical protein